jgi:glutathione S-transferase
MKLYYSAGTCSLAAHIVAREAGITLDLERVDINKTPHVTASGADFSRINPKGYVPALELDDGSFLSEGAVISQYLADLNPESGLMPPAGTMERYRAQSWLNFVATELHKLYSPWLFHPEYGNAIQQIVRDKIAGRLALVEDHLAEQGPYLTGEQFTAADAYLFVIAGWSSYAKVDLTLFPNLRAFLQRVGSRPKVREAQAAERVKVAA